MANALTDQLTHWRIDWRTFIRYVIFWMQVVNMFEHEWTVVPPRLNRDGWTRTHTFLHVDHNFSSMFSVNNETSPSTTTGKHCSHIVEKNTLVNLSHCREKHTSELRGYLSFRLSRIHRCSEHISITSRHSVVKVYRWIWGQCHSVQWLLRLILLYSTKLSWQQQQQQQRDTQET